MIYIFFVRALNLIDVKDGMLLLLLMTMMIRITKVILMTMVMITDDIDDD